MHRYFFLFAFSAVLVSSPVMAAKSESGHTPNNIESCMQLLPEKGHEYSLTISGKFNKEREFNGEFSLTDETGKSSNTAMTEQDKHDLAAFQQCIMPLIKS
ncbi:hypothetical protein [Pantoea sp. 1.19]|uniref:hypothetical protein n=1 Tax=Pantoea sp. 1.19 TaxID=1925589 RepID=UPI000948CDB5|nr:hypothetical protein [Pantoea sp. 1.19]